MDATHPVDMTPPPDFTWEKAGALIEQFGLSLDPMESTPERPAWFLGQVPYKTSGSHFSSKSALHVVWLWAVKNGKA